MSLKQIGETLIQPTHRASCHCGSIVLELDLPNGIEGARRCNCSICRRKGFIMGMIKRSAIRVLQGEDQLRVYQFNTHVAKHYFCGNCGIHTHHQRRSNPEEYGFNLGCLEGVDPLLIPEVPVSDGANHPADRPAGAEPKQ